MNITSLLTVCKYFYNKINYNLVNTFCNSSKYYNTNILQTNLTHKPITPQIQTYTNLSSNVPSILDAKANITNTTTNTNTNTNTNTTTNTIKTRNNKHNQYTQHTQHTQYNIPLEHINVNTKQHIINYDKSNTLLNTQYKKDSIPKRIKELVWTTYVGEVYFSKCYILWCNNIINVFNYHTGHDIPNSKGGTLDIQNLKPICSNCNLSMGNKYTIREWNKLIKLNNNK